MISPSKVLDHACLGPVNSIVLAGSHELYLLTKQIVWIFVDFRTWICTVEKDGKNKVQDCGQSLETTSAVNATRQHTR